MSKYNPGPEDPEFSPLFMKSWLDYNMPNLEYKSSIPCHITDEVIIENSSDNEEPIYDEYGGAL